MRNTPLRRRCSAATAEESFPVTTSSMAKFPKC